MKNLVITDKDIPLELFKESVVVNLNNIEYHSCSGGLTCFKKEGECHYNDDMKIISRWNNECQLIIFITHIRYGTFDIAFKKMIERLVCNLEPYYTIVDGETCHLSLSKQRKKLLVIAYGEADDQEQKDFKVYLEDSMLGYSYSSVNVYFCNESELNQTLEAFGGVDHG